MTAPFRACSACGREWTDRKAFLSDPEVSLCGYQPDFEDLERGLLLFTHRRAGCETTLAVSVSAFSDLVPRPLLARRVDLMDGVPHRCLRMNETARCPDVCECAFVRDVLRLIENVAR